MTNLDPREVSKPFLFPTCGHPECLGKSFCYKDLSALKYIYETQPIFGSFPVAIDPESILDHGRAVLPCRRLGVDFVGSKRYQALGNPRPWEKRSKR